jgi:hypothetical protein
MVSIQQHLNVAGPSGVMLHPTKYVKRWSFRRAGGANKPGKLQKEPQTIMQTPQRGRRAAHATKIRTRLPFSDVASELVSNVAVFAEKSRWKSGSSIVITNGTNVIFVTDRKLATW